MRAIIIAAGMGSRLGPHTQEQPKCMVRVGDRSILDHQLHALRACGVDDLHIVRGYLAERLVVPGATYHHNPDYPNNNILLSLLCARDAIQGPLLTTYSDIIYTAEVVEQALASPYDITLVVDRDWADNYIGRDAHPVEQAELVEVEGDRVTRVGKKVGPEHAAGEFIGLAAYSARGAQALVDCFDDVRATHDDEQPFGDAPHFRRAYLSDLFNALITRGVNIGWAPIRGGWREIDTEQDLAAANAPGSPFASS